VLRRCTFGLLASGGVLFLAGAAGLTAAWSVVGGAIVLTAASVLAAVALEAQGPGPWSPDGVARSVEPRSEHPLELAA